MTQRPQRDVILRPASHGSQFSVKDGSVVSGPASSPPPAAPVKITGTSIELG